MDSLGRKKILAVCNALSAFSVFLCIGLFNSPIFLFLIISITFWQSMARPALSAMMADVTSRTNRRAVFSLSYLGINIGFSLGPIIAGLLYKNHLKILFSADGLTTIIFIFLICFALTTDTQTLKTEKVAKNERPVEGSAFKVLQLRPILLSFAIIQMLLGLVYSQFTFSLPLLLNQSFHENGATIYGILASVNGITVIAFTTIVTKLTGKFTTINNMSAVGLLYSVGFGMLFFVGNNLPLFILSTFIWTVGEILSVVNMNVFVADNTPISHRGRLNGIIQSISGLGSNTGPWIAGLMLNIVTLRSIWLVWFAVALLAASLMYCLNFTKDQTKRIEIPNQ
ncbi:MFS transporter [Desulfosporosinus sp. SB140]|uniref:MFS transporter n=1 Tax=Desulfosporosinus paludis TaxID=3115649 RepID=UPI0038901083